MPALLTTASICPAAVIAAATIAFTSSLRLISASSGNARRDLPRISSATASSARPLLIISLIGETSDQVVEMLERHEIDVAVGRFTSEHQHQRFDFDALSNEIMPAVVRDDHPLCLAKQLPLSEQSNWSWVFPQGDQPHCGLIEASARVAIHLAAARPTDMTQPYFIRILY